MLRFALSSEQFTAHWCKNLHLYPATPVFTLAKRGTARTFAAPPDLIACKDADLIDNS